MHMHLLETAYQKSTRTALRHTPSGHQNDGHAGPT